MKIVIDIPEEDYHFVKKQVANGISITNPLKICIANGTPLPKGHGDLKDTEKLKNAFIAWSMAVHGNFTDADIASIIYNSPTIIKADKEGDDE